MRLIAHRGNLNGKTDQENSPAQINYAIEQGFDVEIDVWLIDDQLFLGHDFPEHPIEFQFLEDRRFHLWCHAKNSEALQYLLEKQIHCFYIDVDNATVTSKGFLWLSPSNKYFTPSSICVMPEDERWEKDDSNWMVGCIGICSDFIENYRDDAKTTDS